MLAPSLPITTERLRLRPLGEEDAGTLHAMESREDVTRWLYWDPRTLAQTEQSLRTRTGRTQLAREGDALELAVEHAPPESCSAP